MSCYYTIQHSKPSMWLCTNFRSDLANIAVWHSKCGIHTLPLSAEHLSNYLSNYLSFSVLWTQRWLDTSTNLIRKPLLYFTNAWPISLEILLESCQLVWPTEREVVCNSLRARAMAYDTPVGEFCSVFLPCP